MESLRKNRLLNFTWKMLAAIAGTLCYAAGVNIFITGLGLYSGGIIGICQLLRTFVERAFGTTFDFDLSGIIYYIINIPIFIMAFRSIGKRFLLKTFVCVTTISAFMAIVPIPKTPVVDDTLVCCVIGGLISGFGTGLTLRMGSSAGGMDIIGIYCIKKDSPLSVGNISLIINLILYGICMVLFDVETAVYSIIFAAISSFAIDKTYSQTINSEVIIISKDHGAEIAATVNDKMCRGVTMWGGQGAYTGNNETVLYSIVTKYEVSAIKLIVKEIDPKAFVVIHDGAKIQGNYLKKLV